MERNNLQHHGIKGMRWGVRRSREELGNRSGGKESRKDRRARAREAGAIYGKALEVAKEENWLADQMAKTQNEYDRKVLQILSDMDAKHQQLLSDMLKSSYSDLSPKEVMKGKRYVEKIAKQNFRAGRIRDERMNRVVEGVENRNRSLIDEYNKRTG